MKWNNRGHEFNQIIVKLEKKKKIVIVGGGQDIVELYSRLALLTKEFVICFERKTVIEGVTVVEFNDVISDQGFLENSIFILSETQKETTVVKRLLLSGLKENEDFFQASIFKKIYLPIWSMAALHKCYLEYIGHATNWHCTLKCKECSMCIPYMNKKNPTYEEYIREIDQLFSKVDYVYTYDLTGGETFLFSDFLAEVIVYLVKNYLNRIGKIQIVTNATVIPSDNALRILSACNNIIYIQISCYNDVPGWNEKYKAFCRKMDEWGVKYYVAKVDSWISIWNKSEKCLEESNFEKTVAKFDECINFCRLYTGGKIYYCGHAYGASQGLYNVNMEDEALDLSDESITANEIIEYFVGFQKKGYHELCKKCKGYGHLASETIPIAEQI